MLAMKLFDRRGVVRGFLRVSAFFTVTSGLCLALLYGTARAAVERRVETLGNKLARNLGPLLVGEPQSLSVNGQNVFLASTLTPLAPNEVLDRLEKYCRENSGTPGDAVRALPKTVEGREVPPEVHDPAGWMTLRGPAHESGGHISCFAEGKASRAGFLDRLVTFMETDDLSSFGDFRYVIARREEGRPTHVLTLWTEGAFDLSKMFPESGDAPGGDSRDAPRPPNSTRLLSAELAEQPYAVRIYESADDPAKVLASYDAPMKKSGFEALPAWLENEDDPKPTAQPSYARAFMKAGGVLLVTAVEEPVSGTGTQVTIVEMPSRGKVAAP